MKTSPGDCGSVILSRKGHILAIHRIEGYEKDKKTMREFFNDRLDIQLLLSTNLSYMTNTKLYLNIYVNIMVTVLQLQ